MQKSWECSPGRRSVQDGDLLFGMMHRNRLDDRAMAAMRRVARLSYFYGDVGDDGDEGDDPGGW
jgi:hypothetical protein